jgi:hypothetical protein
MTWEAISAVADGAAAIAVIVSLLYLAVQVNQNTQTLRRQGLQSARERFLGNLDRATATSEDAEIFRKGLNDFDRLSPADQGCFHAKMHTLIHGFNHALDLHGAGLLADDELAAMRDITVSYLSAPGAQQWWAVFKTVPPPGFVEYLDQAVVSAAGKTKPANERFSWLRDH